MYSFEVHSNESTCRKSGRLGLEQVISGLMLDNIIMNLFTDSTEQTTDLLQKHLFSKIQDDTIHLYKGYLQDFTLNRKNADTKKTLRSHHFIEKEKLRKICLVSYL